MGERILEKTASKAFSPEGVAGFASLNHDKNLELNSPALWGLFLSIVRKALERRPVYIPSIVGSQPQRGNTHLLQTNKWKGIIAYLLKQSTTIPTRKPYMTW